MIYLENIKSTDSVEEFLAELKAKKNKSKAGVVIAYSLNSGLADCLLDLDTRLAAASKGQIYELLVKHTAIVYKANNGSEFIQKENTIDKTFQVVDRIASLFDAWHLGFEAKLLVACLALFEFMTAAEAL